MDFGNKRGLVLTFGRLLWMIIPCSMLYPQSDLGFSSQSLDHKTVHILADDSPSMRPYAAQQKSLIDSIQQKCTQLGCQVHVRRFSELQPEQEQLYSPVLALWQGFIEERQHESAFVLLTDAGDEKGQLTPSSPVTTDKSLILGFHNPQHKNFWIESFQVQPITFQGKPFKMVADIGRSGTLADTANIQAQIIVQEKVIATKDIIFTEGVQNVEWTQTLPGLQQRGSELLTLKLLTVPEEVSRWDNIRHQATEVQANTFGVLHLLGNPSWDGRFLRTYLKSEPKFDLVSFFILRDPWDTNDADERELSLIPFPVERLFQEELAHFKLIVLQNFSLLQFLEPKYQQNLVKFIQDGGSLLFLGGPRALKSSDIQNSPLQEILPFTVTPTPNHLAPLPQPTSAPRQGFPYAKNASFQITAHPLDIERQILTGFYAEWMQLQDTFAALPPWQGHHDTSHAQFTTQGHTPLLFAQSKTGKPQLLASASYPGKGRAIWIFSDQFWRLSMSQEYGITKGDYDKFFGSAINWLLRHDETPALQIESAQLNGVRQTYHSQTQQISLKLKVSGPAVAYLRTHTDAVKLSLCSQHFTGEQLNFVPLGNALVYIETNLPLATYANHCKLGLTMSHPDIGVEKIQTTIPVHYRIPDSDQLGNQSLLHALADVHQSELLLNTDAQLASKLSLWLEQHLQQDRATQISAPVQKTENYYWLLSENILLLCLSGILLEVLARRWDQLKHLLPAKTH